MEEIPRCKDCGGVAMGAMTTAMSSSMLITSLINELKKLGVPEATLQGAQTWTNETFRNCRCGPAAAFTF